MTLVRQRVMMGVLLLTSLGGAGYALLSGEGVPSFVPMKTEETRRANRVEFEVPIRSGSTLGGLLAPYDLSARSLRRAALEHYDLAKIRPDRSLFLTYEEGHVAPRGLRYAIDEDHALKLTKVDDTWRAELSEVAYDRSIASRSFELTRSLWANGLEAGLRPMDVVRLAGIFEYELDFNSELRAGASFSLVSEVLTSPQRQKLGQIYAVRLINGDSEYLAIRHELANGDVAYYHPDGTGMRRPFLRSPLEFSRVTSGYNPKRFHPILKKRRPHNGTDFGAPTGTKVRSVGAGVVTYAATNGGHGRFVKIRHEGGWETSYSHLSRIHVKKGAHIKQGQLIGRVGSTGMSTGAHLHYQMWHNGHYVDAMKVKMPRSKALPTAEKRRFMTTVAEWLPQLKD